MSWLITGGKTYTPMDSDAATYIAAVEGASGDNQILEPAVRCAIDQFVLGCKTDGIWTAIKASCILAGARTLTGALRPLVGTAPTNFNFVSGDYNRKTGLVGDGSTKYLNSNRNNNADPQNSKHVSVFPTLVTTGGTYMNSGTGGVSGRTGIGFNQGAPNETSAQTSVNNATPFSSANDIAGAAVANKLMGITRNSPASYVARFDSAATTIGNSSATPNNGNIILFARPATPVDLFGSPRVAFYSIGESLDLALLDARVTDLMNAIGAAIP